MNAHSAARINNTPYNPETLNWSRLACQSVNAVLRGLEELNKEGAAIEFNLHRIKEDGFIFRLNEQQSSSHRFFILTLHDIEDKLRITLLEISQNGGFLPTSPLHQALVDKVLKHAKSGLYSEYVSWKLSLASPTLPVSYPSNTLH